MARNEFICDCNIIHQNVVEKVTKELPSDDILEKLAELYSIMGNYTRCKILFALDKQDMCVCDLCNILSMSKSAISHQLSELKKAQIVKFERKGKQVIYSLDDEHINQLFEVGLEHILHLLGEKNEN